MAISDKEIAYRFVRHMVNKAFGGEEGVDTAKDFFLENYPNSRWTDAREKRVGEQIEKCLERVMKPIDKYLSNKG